MCSIHDLGVSREICCVDFRAVKFLLQDWSWSMEEGFTKYLMQYGILHCPFIVSAWTTQQLQEVCQVGFRSPWSGSAYPQCYIIILSWMQTSVHDRDNIFCIFEPYPWIWIFIHTTTWNDYHISYFERMWGTFHWLSAYIHNMFLECHIPQSLKGEHSFVGAPASLYMHIT